VQEERGETCYGGGPKKKQRGVEDEIEQERRGRRDRRKEERRLGLGIMIIGLKVKKWAVSGGSWRRGKEG
jgi:hypothetical protein